MASSNGNLEIARILIRNGANVNVQNGDDETPLILAERYGYVELANFLKQNGAIDIENEEERGPKNANILQKNDNFLHQNGTVDIDTANFLQQNGAIDMDTEEERGPKNAKVMQQNANFLHQNSTVDIDTEEERGPKNAS